MENKIVSKVFRIVGRVDGNGLGFILGFTQDDSKEKAVEKLKQRNLNWKAEELELIKC